MPLRTTNRDRTGPSNTTYECTLQHTCSRAKQTHDANRRCQLPPFKQDLQVHMGLVHFPSPDPPRKLSSALDIFSPSSSIVSHTFHIPYRAFRQTILRLYHIFIVIRQAHSEDGQVPNRQQSRRLSVRAAEFTLQHPDNLTGATGPNHPFPVHFRNLPTPRCHFGSCKLRTTVPRSSQSP